MICEICSPLVIGANISDLNDMEYDQRKSTL